MLALRDVIRSRPVRAVKALLMRAVDARTAFARREGARRDGGARVAPSHVERVRGLNAPVTIARDGFGVPGVFGDTLDDVAFGMGWACAEDRLFQMELTRRAMRGELAATFGDRAVDERAMTKLMAGRTFVDLDAFTRAVGFRGAAEASYAVSSDEGRRWVDAYAAGINAYLDSGRRPLEMLLLDLEPAPWTGVDALVVGKAVAFQLSFTYRFALAHALVRDALVDDPRRDARAEALRPVRHPLTASRGDAASIEPLIATTEVLRAVLGADGLHLGSNAFAIAPSRSSLGRAVVASDPHMPLTAAPVFWEVRLKGGGLDVRGAGIPGFPAIAIGHNDRGAWGATAGWGDDTQLYREDLAKLRAEGSLKMRDETIAVRAGEPRRIVLYETPRGPVVSPALGGDLLGESDHALVLRWSGQDATPDADAALSLLRAHTFDELRDALRLHGGPTLNFVWADEEGHIGWQFAGRIPRRAGNDAGSVVVSGLDIIDGDDPRGAIFGVVPFDDLPFVRDPKDGVLVSANTSPAGVGYRHHLGELFEPPFRMARIRALLDAYGTVGEAEIAAVQRDVRSAWACQVRDALLLGLDDVTLALAPRRGRDVLRLARAWDGWAGTESVGALATYALIDAAIRHLFLEDLGEEAFERYFEIMNVAALPLLQALGDDGSAWLEGRDRATIVRDAAAMAEGRLRRRFGDDPLRWTWGRAHTMTFRHVFDGAGSLPIVGPGLRAMSSPGPYPAPGEGTTVSMGEYDLRGDFAVRTAPAMRTIMLAGAPRASRMVLPPGQSGDPTSPHYRDQVQLYLRGETRAASWDETDFTGKRVRLVPA